MIKKAKSLKKTGYFVLLKHDFKSQNFKLHLINPLNHLFKDVKYFHNEESDEMMIEIGTKIIITMGNDRSILSINETKIKYSFYYSKNYQDLIKYDIRGLEHQPVEKLYQAILDLINKLYGKELVYEEYYQGKKYLGCILKKEDNNLYQIKEQAKKGPFKKKETVVKSTFKI